MHTHGVIGFEDAAAPRTGGSAPASSLQAMMMDIARRRDRLAAEMREAQPRSPEGLQRILEGLHRDRPRLLAHVRRVADAAVAIARALPMADLACQHVYRAALVHDIGKLAFPTSLIDKGGAYSAEELAVIRTHTIAGAAIVIDVPYLNHAAAVIAATHERWAGGGFPRGLFHDAIPVGARIIAVADAFDALAGHAAAVTPDTRDSANAELVRCAGTHFDATIVRAWLRVPEAIPC
jgi:HD-GYP domain-containing protein (c-di-GMP phosphodiesterase class II)